MASPRGRKNLSVPKADPLFYSLPRPLQWHRSPANDAAAPSSPVAAGSLFPLCVLVISPYSHFLFPCHLIRSSCFFVCLCTSTSIPSPYTSHVCHYLRLIIGCHYGSYKGWEIPYPCICRLRVRMTVHETSPILFLLHLSLVSFHKKDLDGVILLHSTHPPLQFVSFAVLSIMASDELLLDITCFYWNPAAFYLPDFSGKPSVMRLPHRTKKKIICI